MTLTPRTLDQLIPYIQAQFPRLSPQFRIGARYILDHPAEVSTSSARGIAARAGVQPATLVRLAQYLGYEGWDALKSVFTREIHTPARSYATRAEQLISRAPPADAAWHAAMAQSHQNLDALASANQSAMVKAVDTLAKARRIVIAGFRSSYCAAFSLHYLCGLFRQNVELLHNTGGIMGLELYHLCPEDTLVLIGYAPYSREIIEAAAMAHQQNCPVLAVCDSHVAPMALHARHVLIFGTQGASFFPSTVALQALVEMLAQQFLVRCGHPAIDELARTEAYLHDTGSYR